MSKDQYQEIIDIFDETTLDSLRDQMNNAETSNERDRIKNAIDSALDKRLELMHRRDLCDA